MKFELSQNDLDRITGWNIAQDEIVKSKQGVDEPNYGAIGGALTYSFTPTGLGVITTVTHAVTKNELNLTDYDSW